MRLLQGLSLVALPKHSGGLKLLKMPENILTGRHLGLEHVRKCKLADCAWEQLSQDTLLSQCSHAIKG